MEPMPITVQEHKELLALVDVLTKTQENDPTYQVLQARIQALAYRLEVKKEIKTGRNFMYYQSGWLIHKDLPYRIQLVPWTVGPSMTMVNYFYQIQKTQTYPHLELNVPRSIILLLEHAFHFHQPDQKILIRKIRREILGMFDNPVPLTKVAYQYNNMIALFFQHGHHWIFEPTQTYIDQFHTILDPLPKELPMPLRQSKGTTLFMSVQVELILLLREWRQGTTQIPIPPECILLTQRNAGIIPTLATLDRFYQWASQFHGYTAIMDLYGMDQIHELVALFHES